MGRTYQGTPASLCWATENPNMQSSQVALGPSCTIRLLVSMLKERAVVVRERRRRRDLSMMRSRVTNYSGVSLHNCLSEEWKLLF